MIKTPVKVENGDIVDADGRCIAWIWISDADDIALRINSFKEMKRLLKEFYTINSGSGLVNATLCDEAEALFTKLEGGK
jgi:hypothetical protein